MKNKRSPVDQLRAEIAAENTLILIKELKLSDSGPTIDKESIQSNVDTLHHRLMGFVLPTVGSTYGAPMGRREITEEVVDDYELSKVELHDGAYDQGGAYWGAPDNLYVAYAFVEGELMMRMFTRADSLRDARTKIDARI